MEGINYTHTFTNSTLNLNGERVKAIQSRMAEGNGNDIGHGRGIDQRHQRYASGRWQFHNRDTVNN